MFGKTMVRGLLAVVLLTSAVSVQADVFHMPAGDTSLQFVTVGNPGNLADPATGNLYGSVGYTYQMGKYDVTLGQYCQFLNAVAKTDTYHLYTIYMMDGFFVPGIPSGISQSGSSGSYSYLVIGSTCRVRRATCRGSRELGLELLAVRGTGLLRAARSSS